MLNILPLDVPLWNNLNSKDSTARYRLQPLLPECSLAVQDMQEKAGLKVYTWEDFIELGRKHPAEPIPPKPQDLCTIMYTSGTTGNPKVLARRLASPAYSITGRCRPEPQDGSS